MIALFSEANLFKCCDKYGLIDTKKNLDTLDRSRTKPNSKVFMSPTKGAIMLLVCKSFHITPFLCPWEEGGELLPPILSYLVSRISHKL